MPSTLSEVEVLAEDARFKAGMAKGTVPASVFNSKDLLAFVKMLSWTLIASAIRIVKNWASVKPDALRIYVW